MKRWYNNYCQEQLGFQIFIAANGPQRSKINPHSKNNLILHLHNPQRSDWSTPLSVWRKGRKDCIRICPVTLVSIRFDSFFVWQLRHLRVVAYVFGARMAKWLKSTVCTQSLNWKIGVLWNQDQHIRPISANVESEPIQEGVNIVGITDLRNATKLSFISTRRHLYLQEVNFSPGATRRCLP